MAAHSQALLCLCHSSLPHLPSTVLDWPVTPKDLVGSRSIIEVVQQLDGCKLHSAQTVTLSKQFSQSAPSSYEF